MSHYEFMGQNLTKCNRHVDGNLTSNKYKANYCFIDLLPIDFGWELQ